MLLEGVWSMELVGILLDLGPRRLRSLRRHCAMALARSAVRASFRGFLASTNTNSSCSIGKLAIGLERAAAFEEATTPGRSRLGHTSTRTLVR